MMDPFRIELSGLGTATYGDFLATSLKGGPLGAITRMMVASGICDMLPCVVYRGETKCFGPLPLSHFSDYTIVEGDKSARRVRYTPMPKELYTGSNRLPPPRGLLPIAR